MSKTSDLEGPPEPQFCPLCATPVTRTIVGGEPLWKCQTCGHRQFRRQTVGVAVAVVENSQVLLVKRRHYLAGSWCLPCGHVGWDEDVADAAVRETQEETGLRVEIERVFLARTAFLRPDAHNAIITFLARRVGGTLEAGDDALEVGFFSLTDLPEPMAFATDLQIIAMLRTDLRLDKA